MAIIEEIEDASPAPAPAPAVDRGSESDDESDDEPPSLDSAAQRDALSARRKVAESVAAARKGAGDEAGRGAGGSGSGRAASRTTAAAAAGGVKKGFFDAPAARKASGVKKGFFDAPRAKPKAKTSGDEDIVFLKGKKTTTAGGKEIPDFMRVEVEGSEAVEKMKKELMEKLKPDKDTVDQVMNNPGLMAGFDDPEVMKAVDEIAKNPAAMMKYKNNRKVLAFYQQMAGMVGNRLEKMGDNSTSGR